MSMSASTGGVASTFVTVKQENGEHSSKFNDFSWNAEANSMVPCTKTKENGSLINK